MNYAELVRVRSAVQGHPASTADEALIIYLFLNIQA